MRDDKKEFDSSVSYYKKNLSKYKKKTILITFDKNDKRAFYSLAPLSRALHELNCEVVAIGRGKDAPLLDILDDVWDCYQELKKGKLNSRTRALQAFIKKTTEKIPNFEKIFEKPDLILKASKGKFEPLGFDFKIRWLKEYRSADLKKTAAILWRDVYNIRKSERVGIGFELIQTDTMLGHPLQDYLDSYQISWAMAQSCPGNTLMTATSSRESMLLPCDRISELRSVLLGCELEKNIDEEPFISFREVSRQLKVGRLKPSDASFSISGKGYPGKHVFGEKIGYPSPNRKTRWKTPGQFLCKFDFYPQSKLDERDPQMRVAFTETLPIDIFIETNLVDWTDIRNRNQKLKDVMDKCDVIFVKSNIKEKYVTNLEVGLIKNDGTRRWVKRSDTDVREKINKEYLKKTGIKAGCMGNIPGGEAFVTPEYIRGTFVGDVVIAIDQSYKLDMKEPFVVQCEGNNYHVISAPKETLKKFNERKKEAWDLLIETEKNKSLPQELIDMKKRNFNNIGEFAINTNPKARLCDYLIVNEKIAKMMHIALGSGYEDDRATDYHMDIVFDAPRQKLDVFGTDKRGKEHWILRKGEFVI